MTSTLTQPYYYELSGPPDHTYVKWADPGIDFTMTSAQRPPGMWANLPGGTIPLQVGKGSASDGAFFVATFTADAHCSDADADAVLSVNIHFGSKIADPPHGNWFAIAQRNPAQYSTNMMFRVARFAPSSTLVDVTAQVKVATAGMDKGRAGVRNWILKIDRYNIAEQLQN